MSKQGKKAMFVVSRTFLEDTLDAIKGAYAELDAAMDTYTDYAPCGKLLDELEERMDALEGLLK